MILDLIFTALRLVLDLIFTLLPSWSPLTIPTEGLNDFYNYQPVTGALAFFDRFLPLHEAFVILGLMLALWVAAHIYSAVVWFLTKLHILGGSS